MTISTRRPIQIYLEQRQEQALRRMAQDRKTSLSELIRTGVDLLLAQTPVEEDPAWKIIALGASGVPDLGYSHDRELGQVLENEIKP